MATANDHLRALQVQINRFAQVAKFASIATDGGMGPITSNALFKALGWIGGGEGAPCISGSGGIELCVEDGQRSTAQGLIEQLVTDEGDIDETAIMNANVGLASFLSNVGDTIGLATGSTTTAFPAAPPAIASANNIKNNVKPNLSLWTQANVWFKLRPTWQKVGLGMAGGIGVLALLGRIGTKKTGKAR